MKKHRCFLALLPETSLHNQLFDYAEQLKPSCAALPLKWTRAEQYHLTVQFLGNLSDEQLIRLDRDLSSALTNNDFSFSTSISRISLFPNPESPRILAALVDPNDKLCSLHKLCQLPDQKPLSRYRPHITLAYYKSARRRYEFSPLPVNMTFIANELHLITSVLTASGPVYTELSSYPLKS